MDEWQRIPEVWDHNLPPIDAVVIYAGEYAYRRRDDVAAVPLALFGP